MRERKEQKENEKTGCIVDWKRNCLRPKKIDGAMLSTSLSNKYEILLV